MHATHLFFAVLLSVSISNPSALAAVLPRSPVTSFQTGSEVKPRRTSEDAMSIAAENTSIAGAAFDGLADGALAAMRERADSLKVSGVAVVAYFQGEKIAAWISKMIVVGRVSDEPNGTQKGSNLLAIAYAKAAEMADTLRDSGSQVRPPMTGEFGWQGGLIMHVKNGYLITAFSGGQSADDVSISRTGMSHILTK